MLSYDVIRHTKILSYLREGLHLGRSDPVCGVDVHTSGVSVLHGVLRWGREEGRTDDKSLKEKKNDASRRRMNACGTGRDRGGQESTEQHSTEQNRKGWPAHCCVDQKEHHGCLVRLSQARTAKMCSCRTQTRRSYSARRYERRWCCAH